MKSKNLTLTIGGVVLGASLVFGVGAYANHSYTGNNTTGMMGATPQLNQQTTGGHMGGTTQVPLRPTTGHMGMNATNHHGTNAGTNAQNHMNGLTGTANQHHDIKTTK
ncbi:MAG: hypothetical protein GXP13_07685 [Gammaproteobacteria bacterium]|nr:hypothetical protein [Gammaproteobacteria bacterium]